MAGIPLHRAQILTATLTDVRPLANVLRGIHLAEQPRAILVASEEGFKLVVLYKTSILATGYVYAHTFSQYACNKPATNTDDDTSTAVTVGSVDLGLMLNALNTYGHAEPAATINSREWYEDDVDEMEHAGQKDTAMQLSWEGTGHPLKLRLEGDTPNAFSNCTLTVHDHEVEPDVLFDLLFDSDCVTGEIVMDSVWFSKIFLCMGPDGDKLTVTLFPDAIDSLSTPEVLEQVLLCLEATHPDGDKFQVHFSPGMEAIELAHIHSLGPLQFMYHYQDVHKALPAVRAFSKTSIRIDREGLLNLQFSVPFIPRAAPNGDEQAVNENCIEFTFTPVRIRYGTRTAPDVMALMGKMVECIVKHMGN